MNGLFKKFIEFAIGNGIVLILGFLSTPIISRLITPDELGRASMVTTLTSLVVLIVIMGIDQSYIRYYYDEEERNRGGLLGKSLFITLSLTLIVSIFVLIFYKPVSILAIGEISFGLVILMVIHTIFSIIGNFALINVRMRQKGKLYSLLNIVNKVSYIAFIALLFLIFNDNYMTVVLATILSNLIKTVWGIYSERDEWKKITQINNARTTSKELTTYGIPFIFSMAIIWVFQSIDRLSIRIFSTYDELGLYTGAMTIVGLLNTFQAAFTTFWIPVAYEKYKTNPEDTDFFNNIYQIVSVGMLILSIGLIATKDIIIALLGEKYNGAQYIFPFLVFMPIMYTISETTVLGINFKKQTKYHGYIAAFSAISNIIGNLILVPKLGAKGAAISTGIAYIVFFLSRTYYGNKFYDIKPNVGKFMLCTISVYILAAYSSVHKFDYIILILSIISTSLTIFMYRKVIIDIINIILKRKRNL